MEQFYTLISSFNSQYLELRYKSYFVRLVTTSLGMLIDISNQWQTSPFDIPFWLLHLLLISSPSLFSHLWSWVCLEIYLEWLGSSSLQYSVLLSGSHFCCGVACTRWMDSYWNISVQGNQKDPASSEFPDRYVFSVLSGHSSDRMTTIWWFQLMSHQILPFLLKN